jgi:branched-chain amino acid transport system permease protein
MSEPSRSAPGVSRPWTQFFRQPPSRLLRHRAAPLVVVLVALLPVFSDIQQLTRVQQVLIYAIVAFGLNIGLGYAGEFAVAQPVVLGVAAYAAAILNVRAGWHSLATLPCAVVVGVAVGFVLSAPGFRLRGWYLTITTFFAAVIFPDLIQLFRGTTGGSEGLAGMDPLPGLPLTLGSSPSQFEYVLGIVVVLWLAMYNVYRSSWGVVLRAVRDAPLAAESCGIAVWRVKAAVAVVSSVPVAIAGWMIAHINGVVGPNSFGLNLTIVIIAAVVLGGSGSVWGPVVGIVVVELVALWIGPFSSYNALLVGLAVLVVSALLPAGVIPALVTVARRRLGLGRGLALAGVDVSAALPVAAADEADATAVAAPREGRGAVALGEVVYQAAGVTKRFAGLTVLAGADLTVHAGEVVGLVGPNGSGKTTLLNVITGHVRADAGEAHLFSRSTLGSTPHLLGSRGVRRSFQVPQLIGELSVLDNVRLGLLSGRRQQVLGGILRGPGYRARTRRDTARIVAVCRTVGLDDALLRQRVDELPLGLRRVVEVARALVSGPALVCLDEPAAGLAGPELARLGEVIRLAARTGSGVLLIEHNLSFVREVCDVVVEIRDGRVVPGAATSPVGAAR